MVENQLSIQFETHFRSGAIQRAATTARPRRGVSLFYLEA